MNSTITIESVHGIRDTVVLAPTGTIDRTTDRSPRGNGQEGDRRESDTADRDQPVAAR